VATSKSGEVNSPMFFASSVLYLQALKGLISAILNFLILKDLLQTSELANDCRLGP
jgi:hypothetical protein